MSGRKTRQALSSWATGNFSAGANPWSGQPKQVNPGYDGFTPDQVVPAEELNAVIGLIPSQANLELAKVYDATTYAQLHSWQSVLVEGNAALTSGDLKVQRVRWVRQGSNKKWANGRTFVTVSRASDSTDWMMYSSDGGREWSALGNPAAAVALSLGNYVGMNKFAVLESNILFGNGSSGKLGHYDESAGTWSEKTMPGGITMAGGTSVAAIEPYFDVSGDVQGAMVILHNGTNTKSFISDLAGSTFTDKSGSIPAALNNETSWVLHCSIDGKIVAFSTAAAKSTYMYYSAAAWNSATSPVGAGESAVALTYSSDLGGFVLLTNTATDTKVYVSLDGTGTGFGAWSLYATITGKLLKAVAASGALVMALEAGTSAATWNTAPYAGYYSDDVSNWYKIPNVILRPAAGSPGCHATQDKYGTSQFFFFNQEEILAGIGFGKPLIPA